MQEVMIEVMDFIHEHSKEKITIKDIEEKIFTAKSLDKLEVFKVIEEILMRKFIIPNSFKQVVASKDEISLTCKGRYFIEAVKEKKAKNKGLGSLKDTGIKVKNRKKGLGSLKNTTIAPKRENSGLGSLKDT